MNIAIFTDSYPPDINGVATATKNLFEVLQKRGHNVYVITTNLIGTKKIETKDNIIRIPGIVMKKLYSYRMAGVFIIDSNLSSFFSMKDNNSGEYVLAHSFA